MTDVTAPSVWYFDLQIPSILRRWDGRFRPSPARVPELVPTLTPEPRPCGEDVQPLDGQVARYQAFVDPEVVERDNRRFELTVLRSQIAVLSRERDELRVELADLGRQIPTLRLERDELVAAALALDAEVTDLQSKQQELIALRSEIQTLRGRKSSLEKSLAGLRRSSETIRRDRTGYQKFHDS